MILKTSSDSSPTFATEGSSLLPVHHHQETKKTKRISHHEQQQHQQHGSSIFATSLNFANAIIGAGCIGLGSAIARSGGLAAILSISFLAFLTKLSFDLIIQMSLEITGGGGCCCGYEQLGSYTYGSTGRIIVMISKFLFAYGCLVAYIKIVKDNFPSAMFAMFPDNWMRMIWHPTHANWVTFCVSATVMLPLSLLRDMTALERVSMVKFATLLAILITIVYLYPANHIVNDNDNDNNNNGIIEHWFVVKPDIVASLGTLVFTFSAQHIVNLAFNSLYPNLQTMEHWKVVSTWSIILSATFSTLIGLAIYVTFWEKSSSNIFLLYGPSLPLSITKLLLSFMIMFTYPMPFLSSREMLILAIVPQQQYPQEGQQQEQSEQPPWWLLEPKQLILPLHIILSLGLWASSVILAVLVPSLADVLDLTGCVAGTAIAFVLPAMFSFKLQGYSHTAMSILVIGGTIGLVGTIQSLRRLIDHV